MGSPGSLAKARLTLSNFSPIGMHVLVVDDDPLCLMIIGRMLQQCGYRVTTCGGVAQALALFKDRDDIDLVMSDVYMPDEDGFKLLEFVGLGLDLPVIMMSANGETSIVLKGITHGACDYLIKPVRMEELRNIWQHVVRKRGKDSPAEGGYDDWDENVNMGENETVGSKKRKELVESSEDLIDDISSLKKARVHWSVQLHQQFVSAVNQLGVHKAVPKKVLEIMNVQGLTRENVASHLQKYRLYLKRLSGVIPEPCPVASFQASKVGSFSGTMRVLPAGKGPAATAGMKGLNLGAGGATKNTDQGTTKSLISFEAQLQQKAANRAQVIGGLGLVDTKQSGGQDTLSAKGLQRMSSLDISFLLKAAKEDETYKQHITDSCDDLAAYSFRSAVKLEDMDATTPHMAAPRELEASTSLWNNMSSARGNDLETSLRADVQGSIAGDALEVAAALEALQDSWSTPSRAVEDNSSSTSFSYEQASAPCCSTTTGTSRETFSDASLEAFGDFNGGQGLFFLGTQLDVSDYLVDGIVSHHK